jgi:hypothetical protein
MAKLLMRAALADLSESEAFENGNDGSRFENRDSAHI